MVCNTPPDILLANHQIFHYCRQVVFTFLYYRNPRRRIRCSGRKGKLITLLHLYISFDNIHKIFSYKQMFFNSGDHAYFCPQNVVPPPPKRFLGTALRGEDILYCILRIELFLRMKPNQEIVAGFSFAFLKKCRRS